MPYHKLKVFQKAYALSLKIHRSTQNLPPVEQVEIGRQIRKSSKSIAVNIAEGMGKQESPGEVKRYLYISRGSCDETRVWLEYMKDLGYISDKVYREYDEAYKEVGKMITGTINRFKKSSRN